MSDMESNAGRDNLHVLLVWLIILAICAIIAISLSCCIYAVVVATKSGNDNTDSIVISSGIGMMGVMAAVWASLSVSSIVTRKDVEDTRKDVVSAQDDIKKIGESIGNACSSLESVKSFADNNAKIQKELFFVETARNNWDPLLCFIIKPISELELRQEDSNLFFELTIVELMYTHVKNWHKSSYQPDKELVALSTEGIKKIDTILKMEELKKRTNTSSIGNYLEYRKCGFNFFAGYCEMTKAKGAERFRRAANGYKSLARYMEVDFPRMRNSKLPEFNDTDDVMRFCHLANSIGESYSKYLQFYCDGESVPWIQEYPANAIHYCKMATEYPSLDPHSRAVFYRNLGAAYERVVKIEMAQQKNEPEENAHHNEIVEAYLNAINAAKTEDSIHPGTLKNAYLSYLTYLSNYFTAHDRAGTISESDKQLLLSYLETAKEAYEYFPWSFDFTLYYEIACRLVIKHLGSNIVSDECTQQLTKKRIEMLKLYKGDEKIIRRYESLADILED